MAPLIKTWPGRVTAWLRDAAASGAAWLWHGAGALVRGAWHVAVRVGGAPLRTVLFWLVIAAAVLFVLGAITLGIAIWYPSSEVAVRPPVDRVVYLDQGWGPNASSEARQKFYYMPQGTSIPGAWGPAGLRYSWLINLEQAGNRKKFIEPANMRALGFFVDSAETRNNRDQLPVGFTRHYDKTLRESVVDITCALCHTGALYVNQGGQRIAIRIDGGQAMHAFTSDSPGQFGPTLVAAMAATMANPFKFARFSHAVLGDPYTGRRMRLYWQFGKVLYSFLASGIRDRWLKLYPVEEGFGRTDAVGRISNMVFGTELSPANYRVANAPVSYPAIWDISKFDWVQYTGSVSQPMARNIGESLGVGARIDLSDNFGRPVPPAQRFLGSSMIRNLNTIEDILRQLQPPRWPDQILGPIDTAKAARGRELYVEHCQRCHEPCLKSAADKAVEMPLKGPNDPLWHVNLIPVQMVGTDPQAALNFNNIRLDLEGTGITDQEIRARQRTILEAQQQRKVDYARLHGLPPPPDASCEIQQALDAIDIRSVSIGEGLHYVGTLLRERLYREDNISEDEQQVLNGYGALDLPQVLLVYKARPLAGVWATAPYLHNGSVPNLYEMLVPANQRTKKFFIGQMDFDPVRVGLVTAPLSSKGFWLDTSIPGNLNVGHEFRAGYSGKPANGVIGPELSEDDRWALIEYLKVHEDSPRPCPVEPPPPPPVPCTH